MTTPSSPSPFTEGNPQLQFAWDSTSLGFLKECPRKYQLSILEGWRSRRDALPLSFGIAVHECLERLHKALASGESREAALRLALRHALAFGGTWTIVVPCPGCSRTNKWNYTSPPDGRLESCPHCNTDPDRFAGARVFTPWSPEGDPNRTREILVRTIVWYEDRYRNDPFKTVTLASGEAAAELSFRYEIGESAPDGTPYLFCGHLDRLIEIDGETYVEDYKTTKMSISPNFYSRFSPDNQMSMYALAAKVVFPGPISGVLVSAIQLAVTFTRFDRGFAHRTKAQLDEWFEDTIEWLRLAERYAERKKWPMNDKSCNSYGGCVFRGVCDKDPAVREEYLRKDFEKRPWNPLSVR